MVEIDETLLRQLIMLAAGFVVIAEGEENPRAGEFREQIKKAEELLP